MEEQSMESFGAAVDVARANGATELLGRAALGYAGPWSRLGRVDSRSVELLEEALAAAGDAETPLRARLLARLGLELYYAGEPERRLELTAQALDLARRVGDARALASALVARHYALWRPETIGERLDVAAELRRVAEETGDPELELEGAGWTVVDLLELGDVEGADVQIAAASRLAESLHQPLYLWWTSGFRCARAQLMGDFDAAERLATETLEIGRHGQARTPCTTSRRRCSTSAASRGGWRRSRTPCATSSSSIPRSRPGGPGSRSCSPSSGGWTRRARCSTVSATCRATPTG